MASAFVAPPPAGPQDGVIEDARRRQRQRRRASARCLVATSARAALFESAQSLSRIAPTPGVPASALVSCFDGAYVLPNARIFEVGVLVNARNPGAPPPPLWGAVPMRGHAGTAEVPAVQAEVPAADESPAGGGTPASRVASQAAATALARTVLASAIIARRVGDAWLVVRDAGSVADDLRALDSLRVTRLEIGG